MWLSSPGLSQRVVFGADLPGPGPFTLASWGAPPSLYGQATEEKTPLTELTSDSRKFNAMLAQYLCR
jgi:hypothetical protein